jgi:hypothetical protein
VNFTSMREQRDTDSAIDDEGAMSDQHFQNGDL